MGSGRLSNNMPKQPKVVFEGVSHSYGDNLVLDKVSFTLEAGTITTLLGPNGAGKTTIARLMLGLERPYIGKISIDQKTIAYVPQRTKLNPDLPISVTKLADYLAPTYQNSPIAPQLMEFAQISLLANRQIHELSGGQLQRVLFAYAVLSQPELLILDEPTQALDISGQAAFYQILAQLAQTTNTTIFIISHDLFTVMKQSHQVLCLNQHLCCQGKPFHTVVDMGAGDIGIYSHHHDHVHSS